MKVMRSDEKRERKKEESKKKIIEFILEKFSLNRVEAEQEVSNVSV